MSQYTFGTAPTADIPRSSFNRSHEHKTTIDAGNLVPLYFDEVLPGDTFNLTASIFARLNTPLYPIMDNMFMDVHFFFVPKRQLWDNFRKFMGEQVDPGDSIDYTIPTRTDAAGYSAGSLEDYLGLPTNVTNIVHSALPIRAYQHIYNEWYRDQNLIDSAVISTADGPDTTTDNTLQRRAKRHDYFTSCLPWLQRGESIEVPLGTKADVHVTGSENNVVSVYAEGETEWRRLTNNVTDEIEVGGTPSTSGGYLFADLSAATASTINELRQAFQIQKLLERDARSGTRYAEIVKAHFLVDFQDITYRPEFLGGSSAPVEVNPIPQTSNDGTNGTVGDLAAQGQVVVKGGFTKSFTEHGYVMGIVSVRAPQTYQHGMNKMFSRSTRYDFYFPALAHIGEQAVTIAELYYQDPSQDTGSTGTPDNERVFGYQERWAEYRYKPSMVTGKMRSNATGSLDAWHLAPELSALPGLNQTFKEENPPIERVVAVTTEPDFTVDSYFNLQCARPMPLYSVPGLIDHF
jgi:hypothetical protein